MHNKVRVVRRQVTNHRKNSRLTRLLTSKPKPVRENSVGSIKRENAHKKVVEPYLKPVYGTIEEANVLSSSPDHRESEPLLKK